TSAPRRRPWPDSFTSSCRDAPGTSGRRLPSANSNIRSAARSHACPFLCYKQSVIGYLFAIVLALSAPPSLFAQCPLVGTETEIRTLQGRLIFHEGIQEWFELKLDQPQCGEGSIELFEQDSNSLAILRGCRIKSHGALIYSARGNIRQIVEQIEAVGRCVH